jgi:hypothetical protein
MVKELARAVDSLIGAFAMATRTDTEIRELSPEEWDQRVDEQARKRLGMSGEEFERRLNAGEIDIDDSPDVTRVAMMLPLHATHKYDTRRGRRALPRQDGAAASCEPASTSSFVPTTSQTRHTSSN